MKLKDLGDLLVFDKFPLMFEPKQKIFLTHLLHLEEQIFPAQLPMIYTTSKLAEQLKNYCEFKKYKCINKSNLVIVKPFEFLDIVLERRLTLQILFCACEEEESNNVMVLIRQNGKLNYIYGGNFTDIRSALLNDTFASWIANGVEKLYVNLKRLEENHTFNEIDQMQKAFKAIADIMNDHEDAKIHIYLPLFGYEHFILKLAQHFPNRIKYLNLEKFYFQIDDDYDDSQMATYFINDIDDDERIILHAGESSPCQAKSLLKKSRDVTINILNDANNCKNGELYNNNGYFELFYSPEPSPFHLKLLCMLVKPKRIYGIVDTFNNKSKVPKYLYEICVGTKEKLMKKQERKLSDPFRLTPSSTQQQPKTIIAGAFAKNMIKQNGPFLSDTESDDSLLSV